MIKLKDTNALTYINKLDTVITTIDTFISPKIRLHSIKLK